MRRPSLGPLGEGLAARHLERTGWTVLERNFRVGRKEIDLVATRGEVVAFVEVKTRSSARFGHPLASITPAKRRAIAAVAQVWVDRFGGPGQSYRFDAVVVAGDRSRGWGVEHLEDAWRLEAERTG
jgi:putative endonuclease